MQELIVGRSKELEEARPEAYATGAGNYRRLMVRGSERLEEDQVVAVDGHWAIGVAQALDDFVGVTADDLAQFGATVTRCASGYL